MNTPHKSPQATSAAAPAAATTAAPTAANAAAEAAYAINGQPATPQQFYALACHTQRHVLVEACAGAGKTWMLVSRIVRALLAGAAPEQILAITFTRKASAEMLQRLQEWLADFARMPLPELAQELQLRGMTAAEAQQHAPALQGLYLRLLQHGRPVQIRTFHSWFAALLRAAPLQVMQQLQLPADYELLEDDSPAIEATWQPFYQAVLQDPAALADFNALVQEHGRSKTHTALHNALTKRTELALADAAGVLEASVPPFAELYPRMQGCQQPSDWLLQRDTGRALLLEAARTLGAAASLKTAVKAATALGQAVTNHNWNGIHDALMTQKGEPRKFSEKIAGRETVLDAQAAVQEVLQADTQHAAWLHQQRMLRLSRLLCGTYAQVKRQHGWIDMADVESAARTLLQDTSLSGWLQERLDAQVRHVLIDEFQDTAPLQWQALHAWLASYAGAGLAPSVFIVGDPKQSIYRFRRADPAVFRAARDFVQHGLQGAILSCDHTRRNTPAVLQAVNATMLAAQAQARFSDFRAHTTASTDAGCVLALPVIERPEKSEPAQADADADAPRRDSLTTPQTDAEEKTTTRECQHAAAWLAQCLQAGLQAQDVLIMARKNERLLVMQEALAAHGIRSQLAQKQLLAEAPEVQDIVALLDALVSPQHTLSLARALKSPLFGASDEQLLQLELAVRAHPPLQTAGEAKAPTEATAQPAVDVAASDPSNGQTAAAQHAHIAWFHWLLRQADAGTATANVATAPSASTTAASAASVPTSPAPWAQWGATLRRWQGWAQQLPPHDALAAIYHDGDVLARYAAAVPAAQRASVLQHLRALPAQALALNGGRYPHAYDWVRAMRSGTGESAPANPSADTVRLLTVHGAKGLEARLVLLLDTDAAEARANSMDILIDWPGEKPHPTQIVFLSGAKAIPPSAQILHQQEQGMQEREEHNALYVALTRARQILVLSCAQPHHASDTSWWKQLHHAAQPQAIAPDDNGQPQLPDTLRALLQAAPTATTTEPATTTAPASDTQAAILPVLPPLPAALRRSPHATQALQQQDAAQQQLANIGSAMHRALEWYRPGQPIDTPAVRSSLAAQYQLDAAQLDTALQRAQAIAQGPAAWAWDAGHISWQGNEVGVSWQGNSLRIDRLVLRKAQGSEPACWWVLDYKSALHPERQQALMQQLQQYRHILQTLYPETPVRAAFVAADGGLVEVP